ncbi:MAG TPA: mechanosensitive ion channel domain-containing protein [Pyrinomonadaceae bacterium]|nr:mechanosensitive ion channel domain-containing protein [Pyrinomonadaceae bacterium]
MFGALHHTTILNLSLLQAQSVLDRVWYYINYPFHIGKFQISLANAVIGILIFVVAIIISRSIRSFMERRMARHARLDPGIQYTVLRLIHYFVITIGLLFALKTAFDLDLTTFAVIFSALSIGIGFGLQFIAGDIASGFILLFERPVRVGDFITITGPNNKLTEGRVQSINLRTTIVRTNDNITAVVPNSKLVNQNLINWSYGERRSRISIPIGVAYDSDIDLVTQTLQRAAEGVEHVLEEPKPRVQFLNFGDYSLNFRLLIWTDRPRRHAQIKSDINYRIQRLFKEAKIEIPFPQQDLNLRGGSLQFIPANSELGPEETEENEEELKIKN